LHPRHKRALRHIEYALGKDHDLKAIRAIAADMWESIGHTFAEGLVMERIMRQPDRFDASVDAFANNWVKTENGSVIATHHFGNWELASAASVLFSDKRLLGLYKRIKNPEVERFITGIREAGYPGGLYSDRGNGARRAVATIRDGGDMAMVADLRDPKGVEVAFLGRSMMASQFPASLSRRYGKPLFAAQMRRVKPARFVLDLVEIPVPVTDNVSDDIRVATQAVFQQFEDWIRQDPEQFMWAPKRWTEGQ
ncbi:MAG: lysophospholipid acyltransferase family protein, partial [Pseudomonadota bacterium]